MAFHLICVHPFGKYSRGQKITDPTEVAILMDDRDHHFVRVHAPDAPVATQPVTDPDPEPKVKAK